MENNVVSMKVEYVLPDGSTIDRKDVDCVNSYITMKLIALMGLAEYTGKSLNLITRNQTNALLVLDNISQFKTYYHKEIIDYVKEFGFIISSELDEYIIYGYKDNGKIAEWKKMKEFMVSMSALE